MEIAFKTDLAKNLLLPAWAGSKHGGCKGCLMVRIADMPRRNAMARYIFVVDRNHRDLWEYLARQFEGDMNVRVILDRRRGERRRADSVGPPAEGERRWRPDRRRRPEVDEELKLRSHAIITLPD